MDTYETFMEKARKKNVKAIREGWFWIAWNVVFAIYNTVVFGIWGYWQAPVFAIIHVGFLAFAGYLQYRNYQRKWYTFGSTRRRSAD